MQCKVVGATFLLPPTLQRSMRPRAGQRTQRADPVEAEQRTVDWQSGGTAGMLGGLVGGAVGGASVMGLLLVVAALTEPAAPSESSVESLQFAGIFLSFAGAIGGVGGMPVGLVAGAIVRRPLLGHMAWARAYAAASICAVAIWLIVMRWMGDQPLDSFVYAAQFGAIVLIATAPATWATLAIYNPIVGRWLRPHLPATSSPSHWREASALGAGLGAIPGGLLGLDWVMPFLQSAGDWGFLSGALLFGGTIVGGLAGWLWSALRTRRP